MSNINLKSKLTGVRLKRKLKVLMFALEYGSYDEFQNNEEFYINLGERIVSQLITTEQILFLLDIIGIKEIICKPNIYNEFSQCTWHHISIRDNSYIVNEEEEHILSKIQFLYKYKDNLWMIEQLNEEFINKEELLKLVNNHPDYY